MALANILLVQFIVHSKNKAINAVKILVLFVLNYPNKSDYNSVSLNFATKASKVHYLQVCYIHT